MAQQQQVIIKPILELSQADIDESTSLYVVSVCSKDYGGWEMKKITIVYKGDKGKEYDIGIGIKNLTKLRNLEAVVKQSTSGRTEGSIYYVLNALSIDDVRDIIETYATLKGTYHKGAGTFGPVVCQVVDIKTVTDKFVTSQPRSRDHPDLPRNVSSNDPVHNEFLLKSEMGERLVGHLSGSPGKEKDETHVVSRHPRSRSSSPKRGTRTGGRKNRRRSAASRNKRSRKNYRRS